MKQELEEENFLDIVWRVYEKEMLHRRSAVPYIFILNFFIWDSHIWNSLNLDENRDFLSILKFKCLCDSHTLKVSVILYYETLRFTHVKLFAVFPHVKIFDRNT